MFERSWSEFIHVQVFYVQLDRVSILNELSHKSHPWYAKYSQLQRQKSCETPVCSKIKPAARESSQTPEMARSSIQASTAPVRYQKKFFTNG